MIKFKRPSAPKPVVALERGRPLAEQIQSAREIAAQVVEAEAQRIKNSPDAAGLPIDWIRQNIRAIARAGSCDCKCALSLLEKESDD